MHYYKLVMYFGQNWMYIIGVTINNDCYKLKGFSHDS